MRLPSIDDKENCLFKVEAENMILVEIHWGPTGEV